MEILMGFNAVGAALESESRTVERVWVEKGRRDGRLVRLRDLARARGVPVELVDRGRLEKMAGETRRGAHQGVIASVSALPYKDPSDLVDSCGKEALLLVADGVEDPRNLGALVRTAAGAGVSAVFIPERRSAGLSPVAARAAAGAAESVPVARVGNLSVFIKLLQDKGFWTIGLDAKAEKAWDEVDYPARTALVVGGEGRGLRRLVRESCDETVSIPLAEGLESLNVSVAAGICLFEVVRQRRGRQKSSHNPFTEMG